MDLKYEIEELIEQKAEDFKIAQAIKKHVKNYLDSLDDIFTQNQGKDFLVKHTKQIDQFLIHIYKYTMRRFFGDYLPFHNQIPIALVAMGSYGREELCVYSDIDLMIVYKDLQGYNTESIIEAILYLAWDAGLKLGHRTHKVEELFDASNTDLTIKTAMLESRFLYGSNFLWMETDRQIKKIAKFELKNFIIDKVNANNDRRRKNPMSMEPDIKNSVGGLRDANTLVWIAKAALGTSRLKNLVPEYFSENEYKEFISSLEFLYRVRSALHLSAKKKQDKLILEYIPEIAQKLGFIDKKLKNAQQQLCEKTFSCMHTLDVTSQLFITKMASPYHFKKENIKKLYAGKIQNGIYCIDNLVVATRDKKPTHLLNVIKELKSFDSNDIDFDITYIDYIRRSIYEKRNSQEMYSAFKDLLFMSNLERIFSTLYRAGLLHQLIKPFKQTLFQAQFDGYHKYPVDKHSLLCLYHLEHIKEPIVKELFYSLDEENKALLRLVIFMHDIGKGRKGDHSEVGARIFRAYSNKLGFSAESIHIGNVLIRYHTHMSNTACREDIYNEGVVLSFITKVESPLILKMLYILTYSDVNAVAEGIYTGFTAKLIKELYYLSLEMFDKKELIGETKRRLRKENALKRLDTFQALDKLTQKKILSTASNYFFIKHKPEEIVNIALIAKDAEPFSFKVDNELHLTLYIIRTEELNIGYLLGKLSFLDIINMEVYQLFDEKKYFKIDFSEKVDSSDIPFIEELISDSFDMHRKTTLCKPMIYEGELEIDCDHSKSYAKMTVNAQNQKGMMAYMMGVFDDEHIAVANAKIQTIKNRTRNLFLIEKNVDLCDRKDEIVELFTTR